MWIYVALILIFLICFCYYSNNHLEVTSYNVKLGINEPLKIVHLSDLHSKQFGEGNCRLYNKIKALNPDIIVFTGDLIDDSAKRIDETTAFVAGLTRLCPVFYIYGNHEHRTAYFDYIGKQLENGGVYVLKNSFKEIDVKNSHIVFLGLDENQASKENYKERRRGTFVYTDNEEYFNELKGRKGIKIVLSHFPENFDSSAGYRYKKYDFDIQFSGHAHGGQFRLPFFGGVFAPGQGIHPRFYQGLHGGRPYMIVSRGLGNSGFPLRLFNRPNIVVANIS